MRSSLVSARGLSGFGNEEKQMKLDTEFVVLRTQVHNIEFASCTHQYTWTPRSFWTITKWSFAQSDTYYEPVKSLSIYNWYGSIAILC